MLTCIESIRKQIIVWGPNAITPCVLVGCLKCTKPNNSNKTLAGTAININKMAYLPSAISFSSKTTFFCDLGILYGGKHTAIRPGTLK